MTLYEYCSICDRFIEWDGHSYQAHLQDALREACVVIQKLSEQQAMPDDWYEESLDRFQKLAGIGNV